MSLEPGRRQSPFGSQVRITSVNKLRECGRVQSVQEKLTKSIVLSSRRNEPSPFLSIVRQPSRFTTEAKLIEFDVSSQVQYRRRNRRRHMHSECRARSVTIHISVEWKTRVPLPCRAIGAIGPSLSSWCDSAEDTGAAVSASRIPPVPGRKFDSGQS